MLIKTLKRYKDFIRISKKSYISIKLRWEIKYYIDNESFIFFIIILLLLYSFYFCNLETIILIIKNICDQKKYNNINTIKSWLFELV